MGSPKIPGWGICRVIGKRMRDGVEQGLLDAQNQEAPFWVDLSEIDHHKGRIIYADSANDRDRDL